MKEFSMLEITDVLGLRRMIPDPPIKAFPYSISVKQKDKGK
jgi:hypothetical protein